MSQEEHNRKKLFIRKAPCLPLTSRVLNFGTDTVRQPLRKQGDLPEVSRILLYTGRSISCADKTNAKNPPLRKVHLRR
ncbi:hypothetical protein SDC9_04977 [bioreactor metagenome]|uniref:Uncharacterized protein n=1 Tax=bioreactor metagenome TaxID=1076179 RepID=A0A644SXP2_9ZZZZ